MKQVTTQVELLALMTDGATLKMSSVDGSYWIGGKKPSSDDFFPPKPVQRRVVEGLLKRGLLTINVEKRFARAAARTY
jgi:hypothetical protein